MQILNIKRQDILQESLQEPGVVIVCYYDREYLSTKLLRELRQIEYHHTLNDVTLIEVRDDRLAPSYYKQRGLNRTPTLSFYRDGVECERLTGFNEQEYILAAVKRLFPMPAVAVA